MKLSKRQLLKYVPPLVAAGGATSLFSFKSNAQFATEFGEFGMPAPELIVDEAVNFNYDKAGLLMNWDAPLATARYRLNTDDDDAWRIKIFNSIDSTNNWREYFGKTNTPLVESGRTRQGDPVMWVGDASGGNDPDLAFGIVVQPTQSATSDMFSSITVELPDNNSNNFFTNAGYFNYTDLRTSEKRIAISMRDTHGDFQEVDLSMEIAEQAAVADFFVKNYDTSAARLESHFESQNLSLPVITHLSGFWGTTPAAISLTAVLGMGFGMTYEDASLWSRELRFMLAAVFQGQVLVGWINEDGSPLAAEASPPIDTPLDLAFAAVSAASESYVGVQELLNVASSNI